MFGTLTLVISVHPRISTLGYMIEKKIGLARQNQIYFLVREKHVQFVDRNRSLKDVGLPLPHSLKTTTLLSERYFIVLDGSMSSLSPSDYPSFRLMSLNLDFISSYRHGVTLGSRQTASDHLASCTDLLKCLKKTLKQNYQALWQITHACIPLSYLVGELSSVQQKVAATLKTLKIIQPDHRASINACKGLYVRLTSLCEPNSVEWKSERLESWYDLVVQDSINGLGHPQLLLSELVVHMKHSLEPYKTAVTKYAHNVDGTCDPYTKLLLIQKSGLEKLDEVEIQLSALQRGLACKAQSAPYMLALDTELIAQMETLPGIHKTFQNIYSQFNESWSEFVNTCLERAHQAMKLCNLRTKYLLSFKESLERIWYESHKLHMIVRGPELFEQYQAEIQRRIQFQEQAMKWCQSIEAERKKRDEFNECNKYLPIDIGKIFLQSTDGLLKFSSALEQLRGALQIDSSRVGQMLVGGSYDSTTTEMGSSLSEQVSWHKSDNRTEQLKSESQAPFKAPIKSDREQTDSSLNLQESLESCGSTSYPSIQDSKGTNINQDGSSVDEANDWILGGVKVEVDQPDTDQSEHQAESRLSKEIDLLGQEKKIFEMKLDQLRQQKETSRTEIDQLVGQKRIVKLSLDKLRQKKKNFKVKIIRLKKEEEDLRVEIPQLKQQVMNFRAELNQLRQQLDIDRKEIDKLKEEKDHIEGEVAQMQENRNFSAEIDQLNREGETTRIKIDELRQERKIEEQRLDQLKRDKSFMCFKIEQLLDEKEKNEQKINQLVQEKERDQLKIEQLIKEKGKNEQRIEQLSIDKERFYLSDEQLKDPAKRILSRWMKDREKYREKDDTSEYKYKELLDWAISDILKKCECLELQLEDSKKSRECFIESHATLKNDLSAQFSELEVLKHKLESERMEKEALTQELEKINRLMDSERCHSGELEIKIMNLQKRLDEKQKIFESFTRQSDADRKDMQGFTNKSESNTSVKGFEHEMSHILSELLQNGELASFVNILNNEISRLGDQPVSCKRELQELQIVIGDLLSTRDGNNLEKSKEGSTDASTKKDDSYNYYADYTRYNSPEECTQKSFRSCSADQTSSMKRLDVRPDQVHCQSANESDSEYQKFSKSATSNSASSQDHQYNIFNDELNLHSQHEKHVPIITSMPHSSPLTKSRSFADTLTEAHTHAIYKMLRDQNRHLLNENDSTYNRMPDLLSMLDSTIKNCANLRQELEEKQAELALFHSRICLLLKQFYPVFVSSENLSLELLIDYLYHIFQGELVTGRHIQAENNVIGIWNHKHSHYDVLSWEEFEQEQVDNYVIKIEDQGVNLTGGFLIMGKVVEIVEGRLILTGIRNLPDRFQSLFKA
ncbi:myosin heavy chain, cardiac muscle isoform-like isoform X2 [Schistocerca gregaria]|uniref:myosin heavy chain, cardiac muscle isoform-like isoform X2 n=1 Tax=Schistocerca gregaria TaxID=7010 RepID=UPI00211EB157|nr:myosin heavy chain, cardiac muscle isoform-like isoform X2 [Schistocerca gregaria]